MISQLLLYLCVPGLFVESVTHDSCEVDLSTSPSCISGRIDRDASLLQKVASRDRTVLDVVDATQASEGSEDRIQKQEGHAKEKRKISRRCLAPWDGRAPLGQDGDHTCFWHTMQDQDLFAGGPSPKMCLREYRDLVSDGVKNGGWGDCKSLGALWSSLPDRSSLSRFGKFSPCGHSRDAAENSNSTKLYLDVGANVGACLMPMLARPDVMTAIGVEPNPRNLFYLTNSALNNTQALEKLTIYPFALGEGNQSQELFEESGNAGHTVVGQPGLTAHGSSAGQVPIFTLDDMFFLDGEFPPYIHLMKLDTEGYEVKILAGAKKLLESGAINAIKFELASSFLVDQGSNPSIYINNFLEHGFQIFYPENQTLVDSEILRTITCGPDVITDFVAVHLAPGETKQQEIIAC